MVTGVSSAQIKLSGIVKDSIGDPLEMANVVAIDTVAKRIASYGFTDAKGNYKLELRKNTVYNVRISYVGMQTANLVFKTGEADLVKSVTLAYDNALDEINIVSKMPVTIKGDTIVYNADSFKNGSERKLEDVLKNIPGVEINDAGEIEIEGKAVEKVMIEGKDFFDGDTKLATKNIPSNAVDKIEVLKNFGDVSQLRGVQNNQDRVAINIKLKEGKKNFWFGDVTVGAGDAPDETLYLLQPKLFYYSPKYSLNVIGDVNNLGEVALNNRDIRNFGGGFRSQSQGNGTNINLGNTSLNLTSANGNNAYKIANKMTAFNFSYAPNKKLDLSGFLIYGNNQNALKSITSRDYVDPTITDDFVQSTTDQTSDIGVFKFSSIYKKNFNNQMNYDIIGRFSKEHQAQNVNSLVLSDIGQIEESTPYSFNQNFNYFYTANENNIFALEAKHLLQDEDPFYRASLENDPANNGTANPDGFDDAAGVLGLVTSDLFYNLNQERRVKSNQLDVKLDYYNILNAKSNLNFVLGTIYSKQNFDSRFYQILDDGSTFDPNPTITNITNPQTSNNTEYIFSDVYVGLRYRLKSGIFTFTPGFTAHSYVAKNTQFSNENFKDKFQRFLPELNVRVQFKQSENLNFDYRRSTNFTDVTQIARGIVANNYNSYFSGNPELTSSLNHRLNLSYNSFNLFNYTNIFVRVGYTKSIDQISRNTNFQPGSVVSTNSSLNSEPDNESFNASGFIQKTFNKIKVSQRASYNYSSNYQFLNNDEILNKSFTKSLQTRIGTNFRKAPNVDLRYTVNFRTQENSANPRDNKSTTHSPSLNFDAYIWNSVTLRSNFSFNKVIQNGTPLNNFKIWNATLAYRKDRDAKWEYEIKGNNLLGTGSRINTSNNNILFSVNETFILPRFVSFRVRYQL